MIYLILVQPFEDPFMNRLEIFNEFCIMVASYHLFFFIQLEQFPEMQYKFGWSMIGITIFSIAANVFFMLVLTFNDIKLKFRFIKNKLKEFINKILNLF
jgi:hypothetical protein